MEDKTLKPWQIDINKSYWIDDDLNVWKSEEDFYEYYIDECTYIKDFYEEWQQEVAEEHELEEVEGSIILKRIFDDMPSQHIAAIIRTRPTP